MSLSGSKFGRLLENRISVRGKTHETRGMQRRIRQREAE